MTEAPDTGATGTSSTTGDFHCAVAEFLAQSGFHDTLQAFRTECPDVEHVQITHEGYPTRTPAAALDLLFSAMGDGDFATFFKIWTDEIATRQLSDDPEIPKLEFYMNIFFAINPMLHNNADAATGTHFSFESQIVKRCVFYYMMIQRKSNM